MLGQPRVDPQRIESTGLVIRRISQTWHQSAPGNSKNQIKERKTRHDLTPEAWMRSADGKFAWVPLQKGQTARLRPQVLTLMLAAGFILLIACANLAGLTLVRMLRRTPEIAMRLALGASGWQIQKQLWVENLLLAFVGGMAGVAGPAVETIFKG